MDDLVRDFLVESGENLDRLDQELVQLESDPSSRDLLSSIFRTIHTIKGSCGFLGFAKLEKVAHAGESLLSRLRDGKLSLNAEITSGLLAMVDAVRQMLAEIKTTEQDGKEDYASLIENLARLLQQDVGAATPAAPAGDGQSPPADAIAKPAALEEPTGTAVAKNKPATADKVNEDSPPNQSSAPRPPLRKSAGGDARYRPAGGKIGGLLVERGFARPEDIATALLEQEKGDRRRLGEILVSLGLVRPEDILAAQQILGDSRAREAKADTIRVDVNLLDKLMNLAGELVLTRNQIAQFSARQSDAGFLSMAQQLNLLTTELQEDVTKTRMQPISNIFDKFPRVVRDVAMACGKQVQIEMEGKETELDKSLLEAIKDPLTHIVRNSVDHGIEMPDERVANGKRPDGRLVLRARHEGGNVIIEISDDGAGIDTERVKEKALERGVITSQQAGRMSERELLNLVFLPGFSTAKQVTNLSGRGVGMDVVKTNIERANGSVDLHSAPGEGTTVKIKLPLTLAIVPALIVQTVGKRFAIPQVSLIELVRLEGENARSGIELVHGAPVYRLRGRLLPLVYLNRELGLTANSENGSSTDDAVNIVVLQAEDRQFGLVVDGINDTEEIVVKPLSKHLKGLKAYAGATIMGDGKVALILDVLGLAQSASIVSQARDHSVSEKAAEIQEQSSEKHTFLLFAGQGDSRMALPLDSLARLEEFPASQIEKSGSQWVAQYRGQILPLVRVNIALEERRERLRQMKTQPFPDSDTVQVLVLNHEGRAFGLVVDKIIDIVEDSAEVKSAATRAGILHSVVISERVTELLDIPAILRVSEAAHTQAAPAAGGH
jgi:two-component system, chemotaxis family, sensor kinase CheA